MTTTTTALDAATLCAAFERTATDHADAVALRAAGEEAGITWGDYAGRVRRIAEGLHALGLRRGDALALLLTNRPEFHLLDAAALHLGAVPFSIYATSAPDQVAFVVRDSGARIAITEAALRDRIDGVEELRQVLVVDAPGGLDELEQRRAPGFDFEAAWRSVTPDDLVTLIYTSGTTGPPKGVELTHRNLLAGWRGLRAAWPDFPEGGDLISYLPTAHIADRFGAHYAGMLFGCSVTTCADPRRIGEVLPEVRPSVFPGVPRVWEKLKAAVEAVVPVPPAAMDDAIRAAVRARIGLDRCEVAVCAAAPVPLEVLTWFDELGVEMRELYGLSETCAIATANPAGGVRLGTVGRPVPGVEVRLAGDGEVLVRGDVVMRAYRNRPEKTVEAIDGDGWLHTGDVGTLDADGYLSIVDRKKELIINVAGKNMSPANIEAALKGAGSLLSQACVIGDARRYNVALLTLDLDASAALTERGGPDAVPAEVADAVERANARLSRVEQVKRYRVLDGDWQPGGVELTPTMKLKRRAIADHYAAEIEALYAAG